MKLSKYQSNDRITKITRLHKDIPLSSKNINQFKMPLDAFDNRKNSDRNANLKMGNRGIMSNISSAKKNIKVYKLD